jgi:hypothetical protein
VKDFQWRLEAYPIPELMMQFVFDRTQLFFGEGFHPELCGELTYQKFLKVADSK